MTSGYYKAEERRLQIRVFNIIRADMAFDVVYADQRLVRRKRNGLRRGNSHQKRSHQPGPIGDGHRRDFGQRHPCVGKGLFNHLIDFFNMLSGCDLRHHPSIDGVKVDLRIYDVGKNLPAVSNHGRRGFVTGGFHRQDRDIFFFHTSSVSAAAGPHLFWEKNRVSDSSFINFRLLQIKDRCSCRPFPLRRQEKFSARHPCNPRDG